MLLMVVVIETLLAWIKFAKNASGQSETARHGMPKRQQRA
jgi:hypothetical protein